MKGIVRIALTVGLLISAIQLSAQTRAEITSYDIDQAVPSGLQCWTHIYNGTITNTGRTLTFFTCDDAGFGTVPIVNYAHGGGTLNDHLISTSSDNNQLFFIGNADDGQPVRPVVTLHLNMKMFIKRIRLLGGDFPTNFLPFIFTGATVDISGTSAVLSASAFNGDASDHLLSLAGTPLENLATSDVVLRDFHDQFEDFENPTFAVTEIIVEGDPAALRVNIDIWPNVKTNRIVSRSQGLIPVAILSTPALDAPSVIDATSLQFGRTGDEKTFVRCEAPHDVNGDGLNDLVCLFDARLTRFTAGDTVGVLTGTTNSGEPIRGEDRVCVGVCR